MNARPDVVGPATGGFARRTLRPRLGRLACTLTILLFPASLIAQDSAGLRAGAAAPPVNCRTLTDHPLDLLSAADRPTILLFGELYNERSIAAAEDVGRLLSDPELARVQPQAWLIVAQQVSSEELSRMAGERAVTLDICRDPGRKAYADYSVHVLPTTVVISPAGRVIHVVAGRPFNYADLVHDACRAAAGLIPFEEFLDQISAGHKPGGDEHRRQIETLVHMGQRLQALRKHDLATDKFREALALVPESAAARNGLARCYLDQGRLADAEVEFRRVAAAHPDDLQAALGLAAIALVRGGQELVSAHDRILALQTRHASDPELHFMLGQIRQAQGQTVEAMDHYKRAATLLLERRAEVTLGKD